MTGRLQNRSAIITGSGRGIGRSMAQIFAAEGAKVLIVDIDENTAERTCREIQESGGEASVFNGDVSKGKDVEAMVRAAVGRFGTIDVLCSNAAVFHPALLEDMSEELWDEDHAVNLKGAFLLMRACIAQMKHQEYGRIVLTSSITGPVTGLPRHGHYAASKAGMLGLMRTAAIEFAKYGVTINAVLPGTIGTQQLIQDLGDATLQRIEGCIPLKRLGKPQDIAFAALFLASDEAGFITGQTLIVDGGQSLPESVRALD
jgi:3-oxoacyl-[acyl-carrier protein] reductase